MTDLPYLRPVAIGDPGASLPGALPLAGGPLVFSSCEIVSRTASGAPRHEVRPIDSLDRDLLAPLIAPRAPLAGLELDRPRVMGVINVTPDSFSDGGDRADAGRAVADGLAMWEAGATILDVGGESTRPGAEPVTVDEERARVLPVVRGLAAQGARVSIDSRNACVMADALAAGAAVVNDVTALTGDPDSLALLAGCEAPVILMHMRGEPRSMQADPQYADAALDIYDYLAARIDACAAAGIARRRITVDPGIGFGKTLDHNLQLIDHLALFHGLGCPLLLGVSRKSFIGRVAGGAVPPKDRLPGSLAAALAGLDRGAQILRVHDVAETLQAVAMWEAIRGLSEARSLV